MLATDRSKFPWDQLLPFKPTYLAGTKYMSLQPHIQHRKMMTLNAQGVYQMAKSAQLQLEENSRIGFDIERPNLFTAFKHP